MTLLKVISFSDYDEKREKERTLIIVIKSQKRYKTKILLLLKTY